jgi:hypothetical protein
MYSLKVFEFFKHNTKHNWYIQRTPNLILHQIVPLLTKKMAPIIIYCYYYKNAVFTFDVAFKSITSMQKALNNKNFNSIKKALDSHKIVKCQFYAIEREWILSSKEF